jgi:putative acetyltransferase
VQSLPRRPCTKPGRKARDAWADRRCRVDRRYNGGVAVTTRIRYYEAGDAPEIVRLFYGTVRSVNRADYSDEQVQAWAPCVPEPDEWHSRMAGRRSLVAEEAGEVVGFAELEDDGHLDMLYARQDAVGRGVGRRLYRAVEREAQAQGLRRVFTEASITARPFFERLGFRVVREQTVRRRGVPLTNFVMQKPLPPPDGEGERGAL